MPEHLVKEESGKSLQPLNGRDSSTVSEEKTESVSAPTPGGTSATSLSTSSTTSSMQSVDLKSSEEPSETTSPISEVITPTEKSLFSRARDLAGRVVRNFSPHKDDVANKDSIASPNEVADEREPYESNEKTTPKKSLIQKCMDLIISPKKTYDLDVSKVCEIVDVATPECGAFSPDAPTCDNESSAAAQGAEQSRSRNSGIITDLLPCQEQEDNQDKPEEKMKTTFCEKDGLSGVDILSPLLKFDSSSILDEAVFVSPESSVQVKEDTPESSANNVRDLAARVVRSFSFRKDGYTKDDGTINTEEKTDESKPYGPNEKTTPKKSFIRKCMDKIISPKNTCNFDALNPCKTIDEPTPECDSELCDATQSDEQSELKLSGNTNVCPGHEQDDNQEKPEETKDSIFCEMNGIPVNPNLISLLLQFDGDLSLEEAVLGTRESSEEVEEQAPESSVHVEEQVPESSMQGEQTPERLVQVGEQVPECSVQVEGQANESSERVEQAPKSLVDEQAPKHEISS